ncbi:MAG: thiamine-phosphate kinase [Candidatus Omnitrophota bacterium]|nr:thiamine-phosphate kinase [Candidatus Omnitrophota bacterium]
MSPEYIFTYDTRDTRYEIPIASKLAEYEIMKELELIKDIRERAGKPGSGVKAGIGDDCAVLDYDRRRYLLWASDMLADGTHFRAGKVPYKKIGHKAVAVNISDIAAMGGVPRYILVSIGIPGGMKKAAVKAIYDGIFSTCKDYGIKVIGGDTVRASCLVIDISILGLVEKTRLLRRSGAKEGELMLITGPVRDGKKEHMDFRPRLKEARALAGRCRIGSMIDTSDGIALDAGRICSESGVGCRLYESAIPLSKGLSLEDALYYGESFELLFTMDVREARSLFLGMRSSGRVPEYFIIGEITGKREGMCLIEEEGHATPLRSEGFRHL